MKCFNVKRVSAVLLAMLMVMSFGVVPASACTSRNTGKTTCTNSSSLYHHIDVRVAATFTINEYVDGVLKSTDIDATVSSVLVKLKGSNVELQKNPTRDENTEGMAYEYKSVAGHSSSSSLNFNEGETISVAGKLTYTYNNEKYTVDFNKDIVTSESENKCKGTKGKTYGYDLVITSSDIQKIINNSVLNISKEWKDDGNESKRPSSISVIVYQNSKKYETVNVTKADNWKTSLVGMPNGEYDCNNKWVAFEYTIEEVAVDGYTCSGSVYNKDNDTHVITNTYVSKEEEVVTNAPLETKKPDEPAVTQETVTDTPAVTEKVTQETVTDTPIVTEKADDTESTPQTGDMSSILTVSLIMVISLAVVLAFAMKKVGTKKRL